MHVYTAYYETLRVKGADKRQVPNAGRQPGREKAACICIMYATKLCECKGE